MPKVRELKTMQDRIIHALQFTWKSIAHDLLGKVGATMAREEVAECAADRLDSWCLNPEVIKAYNRMNNEEQQAIHLVAFPDEMYGW